MGTNTRHKLVSSPSKALNAFKMRSVPKSVTNDNASNGAIGVSHQPQDIVGELMLQVMRMIGPRDPISKEMFEFSLSKMPVGNYDDSSIRAMA